MGEETVELGADAFRNTDFLLSLFFAARGSSLSEYRLLQIADQIEARPQDFAPLKARLFGDNAAIHSRVEEIADRVRLLADLVEVRSRYQSLHLKAIEAERLPPERRARALVELKRERDYCDITRDSRDPERETRSDR